MPVGVLDTDPQFITPAVAADESPGYAKLDYSSTLADLARCSDVSVRLSHCVAKDPILGRTPIGEYLTDPEAAFLRSLKTPNLGNKTAQELRLLIEAFGRNHSVHIVKDVTQKRDERIVTVQPRDVILAILRQFRFPDALLQLDISVRLRRVLDELAECQRRGQKPGILFPTLADIAERWGEASPTLLRLENFGRKSLDELKHAIEDLLHRWLANRIPADRLPTALPIDGSLRNFDPKFVESLLEVYPSLSEDFIDPNDPQYVFEKGINICERIERIIDGLSDKEKDVLYRCFGLRGYSTKTLEEIGNEFYVTRERVRQIESKAIKRLQVGARSAAFKHLLDRDANALWDTLSLGSELLLPEDLELRRHSVNPIHQLALIVVYRDLRAWVSQAGTPFEPGWLRTDRPVEAVRAIVKAVEKHLRNLPLPRSIRGIAEDLAVAPADVALAVRASGRFRAFEDYVVYSVVGPQARRTVRFHKVFLEQQKENLLDFTMPLGMYLTRYPEDNAVARIFDLQMRRAPHLFASVFDSVWLPLSDHGVSSRRRGSIQYNNAAFAADHEYDDDTIGNWLARTLRALGPTRGVGLRDRAKAELRPAIPASSIQAILVMDPTFIRLAPGVFGLREHTAALSGETAVFPDEFFSSTHCRCYAMARKAGEPINLYPAWNFAFEAQLCRWSRLHHRNDLYRSLLSVADPESWPVPDEERTAWAHTKSVYGRYEFDALQPSIRGAVLPDEGHVLGALAVLGTLGGLSWVSVNRTASRRLDSSHAVAGLALLVALNAVKPAGQWQERHLPGADHSSVFASMAIERTRTGVPHWTNGNLRLLLEEALVKLPERDLGWVNENEARALIEGLLQSPKTETPIFEPVEPEDILGSDWTAQFSE
jgi:hypothetical protein